MSEPATRSEIGQVLDAVKSMQTDIRAMQTQIHDLTIEVKVSQAETSEKFNTLEERLSGEINTVRAEIKAVDDKLSGQIKAVDDKVIDLQDRQKTVDSRLWGFIVTLTGAIIAYLIKLSFFDQRLG